MISLDPLPGYRTLAVQAALTGPGTTGATAGVHHAAGAVGVYEQCRCDPAEIGYAAPHFAVDGVGITCDRGLLFHVCAVCCADEVACSEHHDHSAAAPACPRSPSPVAVAS